MKRKGEKKTNGAGKGGGSQMGKRDRNNERAWLVDPAVPKHYEADMDFAFNFTCLISNSLVSA